MSPLLRRLTTDVRFSLLMYSRSRQSMFFSFVFPVLFLVVIGFLLGEQPADAGEGQVVFLLPGIISTCIMFSAINCTAGSIVKYRAGGTFKKIATTPLTSYEMNLSRVISGMIIVVLSTTVSLLVAWVEFGISPDINVVSILIVVAGSVTFVGLGMIIAYIIEDSDSVNAIAYVVILPLIVLSGSLFPVERLPELLQFVSAMSPLTYLNNGLRDAMFSARYGAAFFDLALCGFLGFMLFSIGVAILMGREDR